MRLRLRKGRAPERGLARQLGRSPELLVMLSPGTERSSLEHLQLPDHTQYLDLTSKMPRQKDYDTVLLAVADLVSLRRTITGIGRIGTARRIAVWFERPIARLPVIVPRPEWPAVLHLVGHRTDDPFVLIEFAGSAPVRPVLVQVARSASPAEQLFSGWPVIGAQRQDPHLWPVADPAATIAPMARLVSTEVDLPVDVLLLGADHDTTPSPDVDPHPVLGRQRRVHVQAAELSWADIAGLSPAETDEAMVRRGPPSLGAVDERMINPIGFDREPTGDPVPLETGPSGELRVVDHAGNPPLRLGSDGALSETHLPRLRKLPGLRVQWEGGSGPQAYCRMICALASAGTPLVATEVPGWAGHLLAPALADALVRPVDLQDPQTREEHSIRLRRAALRTHGSDAWRRALATSHGLQQSPASRVTVLLVTRRPEMVPFALRQVAKQQGIDLEVVLATHGFSPSEEDLAVFRAACDAPLVTLEVDASVKFGAVLNMAAARATSELVLKMDDDDWYGPQFVADLVMAQRYSGAQLVGCFPELNFLEPLWLTTRRPAPSEVYSSFVAGGTMLLKRDALHSVGGFRHTVKYVDAGLLAALTAAGGRIYRTHGLGYVLRRAAGGHTWDPGIGYFVAEQRVARQWRGFTPGGLIEPVPADIPTRPSPRGAPYARQ